MKTTQDEIIEQVRNWCNSDAEALEWYQTAKLPSFSYKTPEELVDGGRADAVREYIERVRYGGYT